MCQKAKENGQLGMNCPSLSEEYKKDVFGDFLYVFEPFNFYNYLYNPFTFHGIIIHSPLFFQGKATSLLSF